MIFIVDCIIYEVIKIDIYTELLQEKINNLQQVANQKILVLYQGSHMIDL